MKADGNYQRFSDDGKGNIVIIGYDRNDKQTSNKWWKKDGSHGAEIVGSDGGKYGINAAANDFSWQMAA